MKLTLNQALQEAVEAHRAGKLQDAERLYRAILTAQPKHPDASHNLGVLALACSKPLEALPFLRTALESNPRHVQFWKSYVNGLVLAGQPEAAHIALAESKKVGLPDTAVTEVEQALKERMSEHVIKHLSKQNKPEDGGEADSLSGPTSKVREPPQKVLAEIMASFNAQNFELAKQQANILIEKYPGHPFAWKVQGVILSLEGKFAESLEALHRAAMLSPEDPEAHYNLGNAQRETGYLTEAEMSCREAIRLAPGLALAHCNLSLVLKERGRLREAELSCREAIRLKPEIALAHNILGTVLKENGELTEAEASYREAIRLNPAFAEAHSNLGNALQALGRLSEAEASYLQSIQLKPDLAAVYGNLGATLDGLGRLSEAVASCRKAIQLAPEFAVAHSNLGTTLSNLGQLKLAETSYREAIRLKPDYAPAHNNLGNALRDLGRFGEAEDCFRQALLLKPDFFEALSNLLFSQNYFTGRAPEIALGDAKAFGARISLRAQPKFTAWRCNPETRRLRVGLVSGDLRHHPVGYFVTSLVEHLDKARFELCAFPTTPIHDDLTERIKSNCSVWMPLCGKTDRDAATVIHEQGIHILIDLAGHTAHNRLPVFSFRPAPVQASWLGYFATTGLPEMDYFLGDPTMSPITEEHHFSERVWNLPKVWLCGTPPVPLAPITDLPALKAGFITFGCFGNLSKINDQVISAWSHILYQLPNSKLFVKSKQLADSEVARDIYRRFSERQINDDRLILEGPSERVSYFQSYGKIDITLDTFPYPGGTTSFDSLLMGVPVLTLRGDRFLGHLGETIAINARQFDWIADDPFDYVRKAVLSGSDVQALSAIRKGLREQVLRSPLFDTQQFAGGFGDALEGMWRRGGARTSSERPYMACFTPP